MHDQKTVEADSVRGFRRGLSEEGPVYWVRDDALAVFDAQTAQRLEAANYADLTMLDGFADVVRGRSSEPVTWNRLRAGWATQMRHLTSAEGLLELAGRMQQLLDTEAGRQQDLVWLGERAAVEPLVPSIIRGLKPRAHRRIVREVLSKVSWVLSDIDAHRASRWHPTKMVVYQLSAGLEVRRELKARATGRRARQPDLADPVVDMLPELGLGRAVDAVTALLTAITGSPGAAAACLLYEWHRQHDWRTRMEAELAGLTLEALCAAPTRQAPVTARFIKEILRIWSSPPVVTRTARTDISHGDACLKTGQHYVLSSFLIHHDERNWPDPDVFDPDRWLADGRREQCPHAYVPFGWAPKACIGAGLGMSQLVLLAYLLATRYRLEVANPDRARIAVASVVRPMDFTGVLVRR